jgi:hypothetical protein
MEISNELLCFLSFSLFQYNILSQQKAAAAVAAENLNRKQPNNKLKSIR